jgi:MFS family permease
MKKRNSSIENMSKWKTLLLLAITLILSMSTWFSASAILPQLSDRWNLSSGSGAWLTIAVQLGFVVGALISSLANLSDILPPNMMILIGSLGSATVNLLLLWIYGFALGIALRFITGFFLVGVYPPAFKLMSTWFRKKRGLALGILAASLVLGNGMPHLVKALGGLDWRNVIYATSLLSLIGGLIAFFLVEIGPFSFKKRNLTPIKLNVY